MHIKIVGFKCHIDAQYDFEQNSMVLLKGGSGSGKSTILQAIFWALYGSMRGIYNNNGEIKKCNVTLKIGPLTIYRQKRPELLKIIVSSNPNGGESDKTYQDTVAQQIIDQYFGPRNLWKACSYISQKDRCTLLSGSASERLALLNQLSFCQDDPKEYIKRIDEELKIFNGKFIAVQSEFTAELNLYTQQLSTRAPTVMLSETEIDNLQSEIQSMEEESKVLYQRTLDHERNLGKYNTICGQITNLQKQLSQIGISLENNKIDKTLYNQQTEALNGKIQDIQLVLKESKHYDSTRVRLRQLENRLKTTLNNLENLEKNLEGVESEIIKSTTNLTGQGIGDPDKVEVSENLIWQTEQRERQHYQWKQEAELLGCQYTKDSVDKLRNQLESEIEEIKNQTRHLQSYQRLELLQRQLNSIDIPREIISVETVQRMEEEKRSLGLEISDMKKSLDILQCPECSKPLRYIQYRLVKGNRDPVDPALIREKEQRFQFLTNQISLVRSGISLSEQIKTVREQLKGVDLEALKQPQDIRPLQTRLNRLVRVQFVDLPSTSSLLLREIFNHLQILSRKKDINRQKRDMEQQKRELEREISQISIPNSPHFNGKGLDKTHLTSLIQTYQEELISISREYNQRVQLEGSYSHITQNIQSLVSDKMAVEKLLDSNIETKYQNLKEDIVTSKKRLDDAIYTLSIVTQQKELEKKRVSVIEMNTELIGLQRLKQSAIEVECKQLQDTVDTINSVLGDILPMFFSEPISVSLQLYKVLKTKKHIKPGLNLSIKYKGTDFDNISQLSGGEGDRISLALVLALNQVSNSPVILLDECVSSLDGSIKESCVSAMKQLENKTIICVDHEGVEGFYDKTILVSH